MIISFELSYRRKMNIQVVKDINFRNKPAFKFVFNELYELLIDKYYHVDTTRNEKLNELN